MKRFDKGWLSKILVVAIVASLLSIATPAQAATTTGVTGGVTANNNIPEGLGLTLKVHSGSETSDMTPLTEYDLDISVTDDNKLSDTHEIDIVIFYDADAGDNGVPGGAWDCDEEAIYKWVDSDTWSMVNGGATTSWNIGGDCITPTLTNTTGTWTLVFTPGKLAIQSDGSSSEWDIKVTVTDQSSGSANTTICSKTMAAYSEISRDSASITFGASGVNLGATAYIETPADHNFATQVLSNDVYALQVNTSATWTKGSDTITLDASGSPDASGEFGLNIDDADGGSGAPATPQAVTTLAANITGHTADARVATAAGASEATVNQDFYMSLILSGSGIPVGAYSGTITFTVVNN